MEGLYPYLVGDLPSLLGEPDLAYPLNFLCHFLSSDDVIA